MSRYIDAEKLGIGTARPETFVRPEYALGWNSAIEIIKNAPTVNVEEVRHHKWVNVQGNEYRCSGCGYSYINATSDGNYNYCPNCGAKMDGGDKE